MWVSNPEGSRMAAWTDVTLNRGMAQLEYKLSEEPPLGGWKLHVKYGPGAKETTAKFSVSERVLPKFEVTKSLSTPGYLVKGVASASFRFCARYLHGAGVKGRMDFSIASSYRPPQWGARLVTVRME